MSVRITVSICWGSVQTMSSESPKLGQVVPDHRLECHAKCLGSVMQKVWVAIFKVRVTVRAYIIKR